MHGDVPDDAESVVCFECDKRIHDQITLDQLEVAMIRNAERQRTKMKEIIDLENEIRESLAAAKLKIDAKEPGERFDMTFYFEGQGILAGKPTTLFGTRLERLYLIARELKKFGTHPAGVGCTAKQAKK